MSIAALGVRGLVRDASGSPIAGATVSVFRRRDDRTLEEVATGRSDEKGAFEVMGALPAGTFMVGATHPEYAPAVAQLPGQWPPIVQQAQLILSRGARVEGVLLQKHGAPVDGVRIELRGYSSGWPFPFATATQADGAYSFAHVPFDLVGEIVATDTKTGASLAQAYVYRKPRREGEVVTPPFDKNLVRVRGRVTRGGAPLAPVAFRALMQGEVYRSDDGPWSVGPSSALAISDAQGEFEALLPPSARTVMVETVDGKRKYGVHTLTIPDEDDARVDLSLPQATTVTAVVRDKKTAKAIASPLVSFRRYADRSARQTRIQAGASGRFTLDLEADDYVVSTSAPGYEPAILEVSISGKERFDLLVELEPAPFIAGRFAGCHPDEPTMADIVVLSADGVERADILANDGCDFRTGRLTRESYNIVAGSDLGWGVRTGVAAGMKDVALRIVPPGQLSLTVVGPDGRPHPGAMATVSHVDGARVAVPFGILAGAATDAALSSRVADQAGRIRIAVPAGRLTLDLLSAKYKGRMEVVVQSGATVSRQITLSEPR
jgi:hypothetical protein